MSDEGRLKLHRVLLHEVPIPQVGVGHHIYLLETAISALADEDDAILALIADDIAASPKASLPSLDELRRRVRAAIQVAEELDRLAPPPRRRMRRRAPP